MRKIETRMHDADMEIVCSKHAVVVCIDSCRPYYLAPDATVEEVGKLVGQVVKAMRTAQRRYMASKCVPPLD